MFGLVFGVEAKPKGVALALVNHDNGCMKTCECMEWKENES